MGLLIAPFCATRLLANYICVNVTRSEKTRQGQSHRHSKVTQTQWLWGSLRLDEVPKAF